MTRLSRFLHTLFAAAAVVSFTGCASVFNRGPDPIQIDSTPNGARVTIYDENGDVVAEGRTQFKTALKAGGRFKRHSYRVKVEKLGYEPKEFMLYNKLSDWYWGNYLYSGPLGALIIDPLTGNMWKLDPAKVDVKLDKVNLPVEELEKTSLLILSPDQLTPAQRAALRPM
jgi:hypothetical protein